MKMVKTFKETHTYVCNMKLPIYIMFALLIALSSCNVEDNSMSINSAEDNEIRSIFSERCIIDGPYECKDFSFENSTLTLEIGNNNPRGVFAWGGRVYFLGPGGDDRIELSCDFNTLDIEGLQDFEIKCDLDSEVLETLSRNTFRLEIDLLEKGDLSEKQITADIYSPN